LIETTDRPGPIRDLVLYFLGLGLLGFGGPVALVGQMERELVPPLQLQSVADIPLGGHPTRLDYASLDAE
jgi:hypothetical protein